MDIKIFTKKTLLFTVLLFSITINQAQDCNEDKCRSLIQTITPNPTDPNCSISPKIINGCLTDATPETIITECGADQYPTVWFKVLVDAKAQQLQTTVTTLGSWQAVWSVYYGDCDSLILVTGSFDTQNPIPCSNSDANVGLHSVNIEEGVRTYWIAVSGIGIIDNTDFSLGVATLSNCISCIGEVGCEPIAKWEITNRSSNRSLDDPKFCQGEEVTVCVSFDYDASQTGVDWFHGLIPDFGPGWDMTAFDPTAITISPEGGEWLEMSDSNCAPIITEQMPLLCTYTDSLTGRLVLCNTGCQSCPCTGPLPKGSALPSGWFWSQPGGAGCDNDCSPSTNYGIGSVVVSINFCIDLKVKTFDAETDCFNNRNLRFNFQTTSDGVTGCWNDPVAECLRDYAQIGPNWEIDCSQSLNVNAGISGNAVEICSHESAGLALFLENGSNEIIEVYFLNNPHIFGQKIHTFNSGQGAIDDNLVNTSDTTQILYYIAKIKEESIDCIIKSDTFAVIVHPNINVNILPYVSCSDSIVTTIIEPDVHGGTGKLQFLWSTGDTTQNIFVTTDESAEYQITITDDIGCTNVEKAFIQIINSDDHAANLSYILPSCDQTTLDIAIDATQIDTTLSAIYRLVDCDGNLVMMDTIPYITSNPDGVFSGVDYIANNCFRLETNVSSCTFLSDSIMISCISSTLDNTIKQVTLIPNPTTGLLTIRNNGKQSITTVKIINALGVSSTLPYDQSSQVDISFLTNGVYFLNIEIMDGSHSTHKVILVK